DPAEDLGVGDAPDPDLDGALDRAPTFDDEERPPFADLEECAAGDPDGLRYSVHDDLGLDAVAVAELRWRVDEVADDVHPRLLDTQGGDLREGRGLDEADLTIDGRVAAPVEDTHGCARPDADRVGGENVDYDLDAGSVPDVDERRAGGHHSLTLLVHAED